MSTKVEMHTDNNHVEPIYKHLIHMDYPNLFVMGLPGIVIPFPMFHLQAQYILSILENRIKLPSTEQMREEYQMEKKALLDLGIPVYILLICLIYTIPLYFFFVIRIKNHCIISVRWYFNLYFSFVLYVACIFNFLSHKISEKVDIDLRSKRYFLIIDRFKVTDFHFLQIS